MVSTPGITGLAQRFVRRAQLSRGCDVSRERTRRFRIHEQNILRKALGKSDTPQRLAALEAQFLLGVVKKELMNRFTPWCGI